jgi:hypothetical protein
VWASDRRDEEVAVKVHFGASHWQILPSETSVRGEPDIGSIRGGSSLRSIRILIEIYSGSCKIEAPLRDDVTKK